MSIEGTILRLHEDAFYEYFKPYRHPHARNDVWGGHGLETFGSDLKTVQALDENYVWTVVDGDKGRDVWIASGFHYVNRICYLVTKRPHHLIPMDFRVPSPPTTLTPRGLSRQLKKINAMLLTSRSGTK